MSKEMPDKYDEAAEKIQALYHQGVYAGETEKISAILRSAFPPPAEDARQCAISVTRLEATETSAGTYDWTTKLSIEEAAAEIESFAQSRVEPWREALASMIEYAEFVYGSVLVKDVQFANKTFNEISDDIGRVRALLSDSPAKEAR